MLLWYEYSMYYISHAILRVAHIVFGKGLFWVCDHMQHFMLPMKKICTLLSCF